MTSETMRCPTCRAEQAWSDTCRRCKSDLRLLRDFAREYDARRTECLLLLRQNNAPAALEQARIAGAIHANDESRQLLAVCEFLNSNFSAAVSHVRATLRERVAAKRV